ncbi:MAG TPA: UbiA family prenyltransferase [Mycobacteriales bacterium]|nr:UbiA family prenyltransferase [Mycobacteriales bacterium]
MSARIRALVRACHPEPTVAVTAVSAALAAGAGRNVPLIAAAVLAGQLSVGWDNDAVDASRDVASGRADKPVVRGHVTARTLRVAAVGAFALCVPLSLLSGGYGVLHVVAVASAWSYNRPLKSTPLSVVPYLVSFALLVAFVVGSPGPWWLLTAAALLGAGAHFANALPDLEDDAATGVRGLPHRLGRTGSTAAASLLLLAASLCLALGPAGGARWFGVAASVAAVVILGAGVVLGGRAPFRAVLVVAVLDVALLLASGPLAT